ncbi:uncharacterized protein LOC112967891 isoform X3 [Apteryx rowi]|uniref:uncharacterized protein LOC112967891 isoform X3 n=1 Tax=Apteryx rowi TaxID=308060 RepID=UPI000E1C7000|nr:uncharacterized protein LOC112967891 isoform X3 [Apteryx rowi]
MKHDICLPEGRGKNPRAGRLPGRQRHAWRVGRSLRGNRGTHRLMGFLHVNSRARETPQVSEPSSCPAQALLGLGTREDLAEAQQSRISRSMLHMRPSLAGPLSLLSAGEGRGCDGGKPYSGKVPDGCALARTAKANFPLFSFEHKIS